MLADTAAGNEFSAGSYSSAHVHLLPIALLASGISDRCLSCFIKFANVRNKLHDLTFARAAAGSTIRFGHFGNVPLPTWQPSNGVQQKHSHKNSWHVAHFDDKAQLDVTA